MDNGSFNFDDLEPAQKDFTYKGHKYWVVEAGADAARKYKNVQVSVAKFNEEGKFAGAGNLADSETVLVACCVYKANHEGNLPLIKFGDEMIPDPKHQVPLKTILAWPNRVAAPLYEWIRENSNLNDEDNEENLIKRITKDTEKLTKLRASKEASLQKKLPRPTRQTSSTAESTEESPSTDSTAGEGQ